MKKNVDDLLNAIDAAFYTYSDAALPDDEKDSDNQLRLQTVPNYKPDKNGHKTRPYYNKLNNALAKSNKENGIEDYPMER